jgi:hypothetical protein
MGRRQMKTLPFDFTHFERLACFRAHRQYAEQWEGHAAEARAKAAERGILWQRWLKRALHCDRMARTHAARAEAFKKQTLSFLP